MAFIQFFDVVCHTYCLEDIEKSIGYILLTMLYGHFHVLLNLAANILLRMCIPILIPDIGP